MALKDTWVDKVDGVDDILSKDINSIAHSVIEIDRKSKSNELEILGLKEKDEDILEKLSNKIEFVDVDVLPTDNIRVDCFYKTGALATVYIRNEGGNIISNEYQGVPIRFHVVNELPQMGEVFIDDSLIEDATRLTAYYCKADGQMYGWFFLDDHGDNLRWVPLITLIQLLEPDGQLRLINSVDEITEEKTLYVLLPEHKLFYYDSKWHELVDKAELDGALGEASNAIKATASGEKVTIDDISPITHTLKAQLRSKNILPYPYSNPTAEKIGITFTANADGSVTLNGTATANVDFSLYNGACFLTAGTYGIRCVGAGSGVDFLGEIYNRSTWLTGFSDYMGDGRLFTVTEAHVANATRIYICIWIKSGTTVNNLTLYPIIAKDNIPTKYTPYTTDFSGLTLKRYGAMESELLATYTANADGTVNGVTSLYPTTTLMTDTDGVIIDCEYNRDINKAYAALEAAIATNNS